MEQGLRVLIVGSLACGPKVACRLKRLDPSVQITILERGSDISYGACGMPYFISGMVDRIEALSETPVGVLRDVGFFEKVKGVEILCRQEVTAVDREKKTVSVEDSGSGAKKTLSMWRSPP